jgi:hypothetical protein
MLDHAKLELEEPTKQAQAEDATNLALYQGQALVHLTQCSLSLYFEPLLYVLL